MYTSVSIVFDNRENCKPCQPSLSGLVSTGVPVNVSKILLGEWQIVLTLIRYRIHILQHLIWVNIVCPGQSVPIVILRVIRVIVLLLNLNCGYSLQVSHKGASYAYYNIHVCSHGEIRKISKVPYLKLWPTYLGHYIKVEL